VKPQNSLSSSSLPGPKRYPFIGYLIHAIQKWDDWPNETTKLCKRYKTSWGGPLPNIGGLPGGYIYISHEDSIQHVLHDEFESYVKGNMWQKVLGEILGNGIFAVDDEQWRVHRKIMSKMFSRNLLRLSAVAMQDKLNQVLNIFDEKMKESSSSTSNTCTSSSNNNNGFDIDIQEIFFRIQFDVTCTVTFGLDTDTIQNNHQEFPKAFDELSSLCQKRFLDPFFEIKKFLKFLSFRERRIQELTCLVDTYAQSIIQDRRKQYDTNSTSTSTTSTSTTQQSQQKFDLLTMYIKHANKTGEELSDKELRDIIMNVILAGRDTTACALSWTWYELTRHPDVLDMIVKEVKEVCCSSGGGGDGGVGEEEMDFSFDTMIKLKYTHCVALEVLRLHPPVTNDPRFAEKNSMLPDKTLTPAGIGIDMCFYAMGRKEDIWGEDALTFKPERFLDKTEPSPYKYPVFSAGPRMCLGRPLALMNMKLAMAILLTSGFKFEDQNGHDGSYTWSLVQKMKGGFPIHISS